MRKALALLLSLVIAVAGYGQTSTTEHPVFDSEGHYIAYVYADGKQDQYSYDGKWRMVMFTSRDGKTTKYVSHEVGTMSVIPPGGGPLS
jgi:YD repeat-containing protein